ncbi:TonB-dependent receptor [Candidatus Kapabacteria bacterium]|nr:TonB-dependent receptor [Candidatus Kapabacteria bacterium]
MKRFILIITTLVLALGFEAFASTTGKISGIVIDGEGKPAAGATIRVLGTPRGAYTDAKGKFFISGIDVGEWEVQASIVGSEPFVKKIKVSSDRTTDIEFNLTVDEVMMEEVVVVSTKLVDMEAKGSERKIGQETIQNVSTANVTSLVSLTAGVSASGSGYQVRGSRSDQTQIRVDGMDVSDQFTGGFGSIGNTYYPGVSQAALAEMNVKTGGFGAKYGSATGGVVNMEVNAGNTKRYKGSLIYRTDVGALWGSSASNIRIIRGSNNLGIENYGEGYQLQGPNQHQLDVALDGPLPFTELSTFSLSNKTLYEQFTGNSYDIRDPNGNNLGQLPHQSAWVRNITPRFNFVLNDRIRLLVGGSWGRTNRQNSSAAWLYADNPARFINYDQFGNSLDTTINALTEREYKQGGRDWLQTNAFARIQHNLTNTIFYEINVRYNVQQDYVGRLVNHDEYGRPGFFTGWEFLQPTDNLSLNDNNYIENGSNNEELNKPNQQHDYYEQHDYNGLSTKDGKFSPGGYPVENPLSGYVEGTSFNSAGNLDNAYGLNGRFIEHASGGYEFRHNSYFQVDGNINFHIESGQFKHDLVTGFELRFTEMHRQDVNSPAVGGSQGKDIYTDMWQSIYTTDPEYIAIANQPKRPINFNLYVEDQIEYGGFIFTPGLRVEGFYANEKHRLVENSEQFILLSRFDGTDDAINYNNSELFADTDLKLFFGPRININYPISDRSKLSLNYGVYYKIAPLQPMFDNFNYNALIGLSGQRVGNPNMEPEQTNMYEVRFDYGISDDYAFNVQAYYKDVFNELGVVGVRTTPEPYFQTDVVEYGTYRGLEMELRKAPTNNFNFFINYTLAQALGTADNVNTNIGIAPDRTIPGRDIFPYPLSPYPLGRDIRHNVTGNVGFFYGKGEGPSLGGIRLLERSRIALTYNYRSGVPFTVSDVSGQALSERNVERFPSVWSMNLKLSRTIDLGDLFKSSSLARKTITLSLDVFNFLNRTAPIAWNTTSKDPDYNSGLLESFQIGSVLDQNFYKEGSADFADSFAPAQYDPFGNRMYNEKSDFDENGVVTQEEQFQASLDYFQDLLRFKGNYQTPRTVYFNVQFSF